MAVVNVSLDWKNGLRCARRAVAFGGRRANFERLR